LGRKSHLRGSLALAADQSTASRND
jgi:hypothetical protein